MKKIFKLIFSIFPKNINFLMIFCERYLDASNGDNNCDPRSNGEEFIIRKILPSIKHGIIFDVGSNDGEWSRLSLSIESSLRIHLFEPSSFTYRKCIHNLKYAPVVINNLGLGIKEENKFLFIPTDGSGMSSLYPRKGIPNIKFEKRENVKITTVDKYCQINNINEISYMKIDVEGHELSVMRGASSMINEGKIKYIQFEYGGCNIDSREYFYDIWVFLNKNKYLIYKIFPNKVLKIDRYEQKIENFKYSNYIATINSNNYLDFY